VLATMIIVPCLPPAAHRPSARLAVVALAMGRVERRVARGASWKGHGIGAKRA